MSWWIPLSCPEGAFDYPISHGEREFYPERVNTKSRHPTPEFGGPWIVPIPIEIWGPHWIVAGFQVCGEAEWRPDDVLLINRPEYVTMDPAEIAPKRLRKTDGSYAGCSWQGQSFSPDADGIVTVPHLAVGELVESHGFEEVLEAPAQIDAALDDLSAGVAAEQEKVEALREQALTQIPEEQAEAARAQIEEERHESPPQDYRTQRRTPRH